jgi:iron-sulfur cluster assembly protein
MVGRKPTLVDYAFLCSEFVCLLMPLLLLFFFFFSLCTHFSSGMSYVMDFCDANTIEEDDAVDVYEQDKIQCVVDAKSMLYLYGLELDYSTDLIGGGFKVSVIERRKTISARCFCFS